MEKSLYRIEGAILCNLLLDLRLKAELTQEQLAERLNCPRTRVTRIEIGDRRLDLVECRQYCAALGISLVELIAEFERRLALRDP